MALTLTTNELRRTIVVTSSSANAKANAYFELKDRIKGLVSNSVFKTRFESFLNAAGEANVPAVAASAVKFCENLNSFFPSRKDAAYSDCIDSCDYFTNLSSLIANDSYPKWEVNLFVKKYATSDGGYIELPVGGQVTGKWTPTGQKIMM